MSDKNDKSTCPQSTPETPERPAPARRASFGLRVRSHIRAGDNRMFDSQNQNGGGQPSDEA